MFLKEVIKTLKPDIVCNWDIIFHLKLETLSIYSIARVQMTRWNIFIKDETPNTMCILFIAFLVYSYYNKPFHILCGYYILFSHLFLIGIEVSGVNAWIIYPIAVGLGMAVGEVVKEDVHFPYRLPHIIVVVFGVIPLGITWGLFPVIFVTMTLISGYKRMAAYSAPTLAITAVISTQIGAAPLVALCTAAFGLLPFAVLCPLFPKEIPFDEV